MNLDSLLKSYSACHDLNSQLKRDSILDYLTDPGMDPDGDRRLTAKWTPVLIEGFKMKPIYFSFL